MLAAEANELVRSQLSGFITTVGLPTDLKRRVVAQLSKPPRLLNPDAWDPLAVLPMLTFHSSKGGSVEDAAHLGVAMECFLAAGDALDDLQDDDDPSVVDALSAAPVAELITALIVLSNTALSVNGPSAIPDSRRLAAVSEFSRFQLMAMSGQHDDNRIIDPANRSVASALAISEQKSGSIGELAARLGAVSATEDASVIDLHARFGRALGLCMQVANDIEGAWPCGPESTDRALSKNTLPLAFESQYMSQKFEDNSGTSSGSRQPLPYIFSIAVALAAKQKAARLADQITNINRDSTVAEMLR